MAKIAGRNARLYLAIASGGTAEPVASIKSFEITGTTDRYDASTFGDTSKTYVSGLPDASGSFSGIFDTTNGGGPTVTAAQDGIARKFYFYWDTVGDPTHYYFGTAFWDFGASFAVDALAEVTGSWSAASSLTQH